MKTTKKLAGFLIICAGMTTASHADDNAALRYWQAFAMMPDDQAMDQILDADVSTAGATEYLASARQSLDSLHAAAQRSRCDWDLDYSKGIELTLPHLSKARQLARLAMVSAKWSWADYTPAGDWKARATTRPAERPRAKNPAQAWTTVGDVMVLSRHVQSSPLVINVLVGIGIQHMALNEAAMHVPTDSPELIDGFMKRLDALPPAATMKDCLLLEKKFGHDMLRLAAKKPDDARQMLKEGGSTANLNGVPIEATEEALKAVDATYDRLIESCALPMPERARVLDHILDEAAKKVAAGSPGDLGAAFVQAVMPAMSSVSHSYTAGEVELELFRAGVAVQKAGDESLKLHLDPTDGQPFAYQKTGHGFILTSRYEQRNKVLTMQFGPKD